MFDVPSLSDLNIAATLPASFLALYACLLMVVDLFIPRTRKHITAGLTMLGLAISLVLALLPLGGVARFGDGEWAFRGMYIADSYSDGVNVIALITGLLGVLVAYNYLDRIQRQRGEYYYLLLFTTLGVMIMGAAGDLVVVFVALELLSIPLYILSGFRWPQEASEESALKYFILGSFASSFLVYGIALVYGATGVTDFQGIWRAVEDIIAEDASSKYLLLIGAGMLLVGLGFKVAAVPFHMWTPDVYQGAPTPVTGFMAAATKLAAFAAMLRFMNVVIPGLQWDLAPALWTVIALTMLVGTVLGIVQGNVKRMLAYSSIAHAGFVLLGVVALQQAGISSVLFYLLAYGFATVGAFAVVTLVRETDPDGNITAEANELTQWAGLGKRSPLLAASMLVFLLSFAGIPLTAGFMGKFTVFTAAVQGGLGPLVVLAVLASAATAFFYVRLIVLMYFTAPDGDTTVAVESEGMTTVAIAVSVVATLALGLFPGPVLETLASASTYLP